MITLHGGVTITIQGARREVSGSWIIAYGTDTFSVAAGYDLMTGERSGGYSCATTLALILAPSLSAYRPSGCKPQWVGRSKRSPRGLSLRSADPQACRPGAGSRNPSSLIANLPHDGTDPVSP